MALPAQIDPVHNTAAGNAWSSPLCALANEADVEMETGCPPLFGSVSPHIGHSPAGSPTSNLTAGYRMLKTNLHNQFSNPVFDNAPPAYRFFDIPKGFNFQTHNSFNKSAHSGPAVQERPESSHSFDKGKNNLLSADQNPAIPPTLDKGKTNLLFADQNPAIPPTGQESQLPTGRANEGTATCEY